MKHQLSTLVLVLNAALSVYAQGRGAAGPPPTAKAAAPLDMTGYCDVLEMLERKNAERLFPRFKV